VEFEIVLTQPHILDDPDGHDDLDVPDDPDKTNDPNVPDYPDGPDDPNKPDDPDEPDDSDGPDDLDGPDNPCNPNDLDGPFLSQPKSRREGEPKKKTGLKRDWSRHHSYFWKTMENHKNKASLRKNQSFGFGSRLRIGKVLAPYSARPRAVPLIKHAKLMWFSKH